MPVRGNGLGAAGRVCFWRNGLDLGNVRPPEEGEDEGAYARRLRAEFQEGGRRLRSRQEQPPTDPPDPDICSPATTWSCWTPPGARL